MSDSNKAGEDEILIKETGTEHETNNIKCRCGCVPNILSLFEMAALRDKRKREKALKEEREKLHNNNNNDNNNNNENEIIDMIADLDTNVSLPLRIIGHNISSYINEKDNNIVSKSSNDVNDNNDDVIGILIGHGLGPKNPKEKNHLNDKYVDMALNAINERDKLKNISSPIMTITYTARGHGYSTGWESTAASNPDQFTWIKLADDMVSLASKFHLSKFIACGSSMGSATSLYAAINYPERVHAIIMMRPPTAWNDRLMRRKTLLSSANKCQEASIEGELHHLVIRGTAYSDLPSIEDIESYGKIKCPLLILTVEGDDSHPVSTAEAIKSMVPHAELYIAENDKKATKTWPNLIKTFVERVTIKS